MSLMLAPILPWNSPAPARGRGRVPVASHRPSRLKHLRCAYRHYVDGVTLPRLASHYRVSRRTISLWIAAVLDVYDDPEAIGLRRMLGVDEPDADIKLTNSRGVAGRND